MSRNSIEKQLLSSIFMFSEWFFKTSKQSLPFQIKLKKAEHLTDRHNSGRQILWEGVAASYSRIQTCQSLNVLVRWSKLKKKKPDHRY